MSMILPKAVNIYKCFCENRVPFKKRVILLFIAGFIFINLQVGTIISPTKYNEIYNIDNKYKGESWISNLRSLVENYLNRKYISIF